MVEFKFECEDFGRTAPSNDNRLGDIRFRKLLGAKDWNALPAAIRARFSKRVKGGQSTIYKGYVVKTEVNRAGRIFANLLRLIGAPLPLDSQNADAPAVVTVTEDADYKGQFWSRNMVVLMASRKSSKAVNNLAALRDWKNILVTALA